MLGFEREQEAVDQLLTKVFGHERLRPGQGEVIADVLASRPVLAVMPTGSGKSLCYQLPAVFFARSGGITIVVSPLIALMKDQVDALNDLGVRAASLTSADDGRRQSEILAGLADGKVPLLYVAPERFQSGRFLDALETVQGKLALFAIDEAHCISEWGHDFRPSYRALGEAIKRLQPKRVVALTATATPEVREDICAQLELDAENTHVHGFARSNLNLSLLPVKRKSDKDKLLVEMVRTRPGGTALIYAATRKNTERYAAALSEAGMSVAVYHAGMRDSDRVLGQDAFMSGKLDAIVATNAFGMGVDKADIRLVAHADIPRSPEAYYQEAGRAGRDGAPADCTLLFQQSDVRLQEFLIDMSYPRPELLRGLWKLLRERPELGVSVDVIARELPGDYSAAQVSAAAQLLAKHGLLYYDGPTIVATTPRQGADVPKLDPEALARRAEVERAKLSRMVAFAYTTSCRHRFLLNYFGDKEQPSVCRACDSCQNRGLARVADERERGAIRALLETISKRSGRLGRKKLAEITRENDDSEALGFSAPQLIDLLDACEGAGLVISTSGHYPTLAITDEGRDALRGAVPDVHILAKPEKAKGSKKKRSPADEAMLASPAGQRLAALRRELARERAVPSYVIYNNRTMAAIAEANPENLEELGRVNGIGPAKLTSFGEAILAALRS